MMKMSELGDIYWQGCAEGKILYHQCAACGHVQSYPRPQCHVCGAKANQWKESAKRGTVVGYSTVHLAPTPEFAALTPYRLLLVDLAEGPRIISHGEMALKVNDKITIEFRPVGARNLPYCKAA
jgi:uncharacterized protein